MAEGGHSRSKRGSCTSAPASEAAHCLPPTSWPLKRKQRLKLVTYACLCCPAVSSDRDGKQRSRGAESRSTTSVCAHGSATTLKMTFTALILSRWAARGAVLSPRNGPDSSRPLGDHHAGPDPRGVSRISRRVFTREESSLFLSLSKRQVAGR